MSTSNTRVYTRTIYALVILLAVMSGALTGVSCEAVKMVGRVSTTRGAL